MARYGQAFKQRAVARLLPPESSPVEVVAREIGVSADTLERWRSEALAASGGQPQWTAAARLEAVIATASLDEAGKSAWCREQGVFPSELERWRANAVAALGLAWAVAMPLLMHLAKRFDGMREPTVPEFVQRDWRASNHA